MTHETDTAQSGKKKKKTAVAEREQRLKAALKSNMGRRKAQARARISSEDDGGDQTNEQKD
ncbi:hypothetical protein [Halocynthiibacter sp.]|uniref:hypothetical protein n=1 Tax=Halocynthiibacter sp. TaxID=1979210 RepID=UPI003C31553A